MVSLSGQKKVVEPADGERGTREEVYSAVVWFGATVQCRTLASSLPSGAFTFLGCSKDSTGMLACSTSSASMKQFYATESTKMWTGSESLDHLSEEGILIRQKEIGEEEVWFTSVLFFTEEPAL